jgi:pyruvoyl-dependent arginine decarboxylase (PvlArgDC)
MRFKSALSQFIILIFLFVLTVSSLLPNDATVNASKKNKKNYLFQEQVVVTAVLSNGTFTMPGHNISIGLRWQK